MAKKLAKVILVILLIVIALVAIAALPRSWDYYKHEREAKKLLQECKELEIGMTRDEVIAIMGEPFNTGEHEKHGVSYSRLYFPARRLASTAPQCVIDHETGLVIEIICSDGYRLTTN